MFCSLCWFGVNVKDGWYCDCLAVSYTGRDHHCDHIIRCPKCNARRGAARTYSALKEDE